MNKNVKKVILFIGLTFFFNWLMATLFFAFGGISLMVVKGRSDLTVGVTGLAGFIVLVFVNIGLLLFGRVPAIPGEGKISFEF